MGFVVLLLELFAEIFEQLLPHQETDIAKW